MKAKLKLICIATAGTGALIALGAIAAAFGTGLASSDLPAAQKA